MKIIKSSVFIAMILLLTLMLTKVSFASSGSASCALGLCHCEVSCTAPAQPNCTSGVFTCSCTCSTPGAVSRPSLSSQQLSDASSFNTWLANYGSTSMSNLATKESAVVASLSIDDATYSAAERDYSDARSSLNSTELADIATWRSNHGYYD